MAANRGVASVLAKYGPKLAAAAEKSAAAPIEYDKFGGLPPGITNGTAQLVDCRFALYEKGDMKGEAYFIAAGVVKTPDDVDTYDRAGNKTGSARVRGKRTQIMEPICDTPTRSRKTQEEHIAWIQNEMKKLLGPDYDPDSLSVENLENTAAALMDPEACPHFHFSTRAGSYSELKQLKDGVHLFVDGKDTGKKWPTEAAAKLANKYAGQEPMTFETWNGVCEAPAPVGAGTNGAGPAKPTRMVDQSPPATPDEPEEPTEPVAEETEEPTAAEGSEENLAELAEAADGGNKTAAKQLKAIALEAGLDAGEVDNADDWAAVVAMIEEARAGTEVLAEEEEPTAEEPAAEEPWQPAVGQIYLYRPVDSKGKVAKKAVEVNVDAVSVKKETVTIHALDNVKQIYKDIPWTKLEGEE